MDSQSACLHSSQFRVLEDIKGEEYFNKFIKEASQVNSKQLCMSDEDQSVIITYRRGGMLDNILEEKEENNQQQNEIQINLGLEYKHLSQLQLLRIMKFLQKNKMGLQKYLNSGGEADVYLGYLIDKDGNKLERVLRIIKATNNNQIQEIKEEYQRMTAIKNPMNLVQYESLIELSSGIFIFIMDYYQGSLKDKMAQKMSIDLFWSVVFDLFDGLIELRTHNIIHSDIKPANILLNSKGRCFYSDFGMSLKLKNRQQITDDNKGYSLKYCSPEHLNGQTLSYASDMYSIGQLVLHLTQQLENEDVLKTIEEFLKENLLQEEPNKRIKIENLIPQFILKVSSVLQKQYLDQYLLKIQKQAYQEESSNDVDPTINKFVHQKMKYSYKLVQVIYIYIAFNKSELVTFKSIEDVEFQFFSFGMLADLFLDIVKIPGDQLSHVRRQQYLESAILIFKSQNLNNRIVSKIIECEYLLGGILFNQAVFQTSKYQQSIEHFQSALTPLLQYFPTEHAYISSIYDSIGQSYSALTKYEEGVKYLQKSIDELKLCCSEASLIFKQHYLGLCYELAKDKQNALKQYQEVVMNWKKNFKMKKVERLIEEKDSLLSIVASSLHEVGEYTESFQVEIQNLRQDNQKLESLEKMSLSIIKNNIQKFSSDQISSALDNILGDENNDVVKKMVLYEFMSYFDTKGEHEQILKILQPYNSIKEEIQIDKQAKLSLILVSYFKKINNQNEAIKHLEEGVNILNRPNINATPYLLTTELDLFSQLIDDVKMQDLAVKCFKRVEEQSKTIQYNHPIEKDKLFRKIQTLKVKHAEKIGCVETKSNQK